jgi:hypothetical protein
MMKLVQGNANPTPVKVEEPHAEERKFDYFGVYTEPNVVADDVGALMRRWLNVKRYYANKQYVPVAVFAPNASKHILYLANQLGFITVGVPNEDTPAEMFSHTAGNIDKEMFQRMKVAYLFLQDGYRPEWSFDIPDSIVIPSHLAPDHSREKKQVKPDELLRNIKQPKLAEGDYPDYRIEQFMAQRVAIIPPTLPLMVPPGLDFTNDFSKIY